MNEFIENLIGRLEEEIKKINDEPWIDCEERIKKQCIYCKTIKIVNELAEKYNGVCCEWKKYENDIIFPYKTSCGTSDLYDDSYKYCPYCGKKIKVVE